MKKSVFINTCRIKKSTEILVAGVDRVSVKAFVRKGMKLFTDNVEKFAILALFFPIAAFSGPVHCYSGYDCHGKAEVLVSYFQVLSKSVDLTPSVAKSFIRDASDIVLTVRCGTAAGMVENVYKSEKRPKHKKIMSIIYYFMWPSSDDILSSNGFSAATITKLKSIYNSGKTPSLSGFSCFLSTVDLTKDSKTPNKNLNPNELLDQIVDEVL